MRGLIHQQRHKCGCIKFPRKPAFGSRRRTFVQTATKIHSPPLLRPSTRRNKRLPQKYKTKNQMAKIKINSYNLRAVKRLIVQENRQIFHFQFEYF